MDLGSYLVVKFMDIQSDDKILDLCCAPGSKLLFILDKIKEASLI
jgi:16S rRNA C967 or C1407 C5-methylase (RsmB/RsmF family)